MRFYRFRLAIGAILMAGFFSSSMPVQLAAQTTNQVVASVLGDRRPPGRLTTPQLRQRLRKLELVIDARGVKKKWKRQARVKRQADRAELRRRINGGRAVNNRPNRTNVLNDRRRSRTLNDTQLLRRLARLERLIDARGVSRKLKRRARNMRLRDRAELDRRRSGGYAPGGGGGGYVPDRVFRVLNDNRPPRRLNDSQLLSRMARLERVIDARGVTHSQKSRARNMRLRDRRELDRRRRFGNSGYQDNTPYRGNITNVLNDNRPARSLSDSQLLRRLSRLERLIDAVGVPYGQKSEARIKRFADQAELNRRRGY